jgi:prevent-host-death family protein
MKTITIKQTRDNLAEIIEQVAVAGTRYTVTKFNKPKALIIPITDVDITVDQKRAQLRAQKGSWINRTDIKDVVEWSSELRKKASSRIE